MKNKKPPEIKMNSSHRQQEWSLKVRTGEDFDNSCPDLLNALSELKSEFLFSSLGKD